MRKYFPVLLLLVAGSQLHGQVAPVKAGQRINLTPYSKVLTLAERNAQTRVWQLPDNVWTSPRKPQHLCDDCFLDFGHEEKPVWLRIDLQGADPKQSEWLLELAFPNLRELNFYLVKKGDLQRETPGGTRLEFFKREIPARTFGWPVSLKDGENATVYIYIDTPGQLKTPLYISDYTLYFQDQNRESLFYGLYFGAALGILLYNLFLLLKLRDASYLLYVLYGVSFLVLMAGISGLGYQYLWPGSVWMHRYFFPLCISLIFFFLPLFVGNLLGVFRESRRVQLPVFLQGILALLLFGLTFVLPTSISFVLAYALIGTGVVITLFLIIRALLQRNRAARFLLLAFGLLVPVSVIMVLRAIKALPAHFLFDESIYLGSLAELLLFSFALSDRFEQSELGRQITEAKARSRALFFSAVGHDLRQPLGVILGYAEHLQRYPDDAEARQIVQKMADSARTLETILQDVMDFDRLESGRMIPQMAELDIDRDLFAPLQNIFIAKAEAKGLSIIFENDAPRRYAADVPRVLRVLMNLISNAVKYTERGGILVSFREKRVNEKIFGEFSIRDSGIGMSHDDLQLIFQEYVRVGKYSSDLKTGVGLGLTIVKRLVEYLQGEILVESEPGQGSVFILRLPLVPFDNHFREVILQSEGRRNLAGLQVLAVDDDPDQLQLLARVTQGWNLSLSLAHTQAEALEKLTDRNFECDVVLLDWNLGANSGLDTAEHIWSLRPGLQIIFVSGEDSLAGRVFPVEVRSVLSKPIRLEFLYRELWGVSLSKRR